MPNYWIVSKMRQLNRIQLSAKQLQAILTIVKMQAPCKFLIFGLGNDSRLWADLNHNGLTIFIEDNIDWFNWTTRRDCALKAYLVDYHCRRGQWQQFLNANSAELANFQLPDEVLAKRWDAILVDGPAGWHNSSPGRMKSIFWASRLVADSGHVFVHDCDRVIEDIYCKRFLGDQNLVKEIKAAVGYLRHYQMNLHNEKEQSTSSRAAML